MSIDDNIASLFSLAQDAKSNALAVSGRISTAYPNINGADLGYTPSVPALAKPPVLSDFLVADNSSATLRFVDGEVEALVDQYFPEINACLRYSPEEWLCGIITGQKPFGLSREVFEAIWHEGRDREGRTRRTAVAQIRADFSRRGFTVPPGAMIQALTQAEEGAADAIGAVNRAQMVRDSEIKLDLLKFAEQQAITLKAGLFQAIANYYRVLMDLPSKDIEAGRMKVAAYASFNDALSDIYRVQLGFEELRLQAANLRMNGKLDESRIRIAAADGSRNGALGQATDAFASIAASAASAASTLNANILSDQ